MNDYVLGLELLIIGMGTVFLSLYLLSVFLHFSGKVFGPESTKKNKKKVKSESVVSEDNADKVTKPDQKISSKKAAVITAAVYKMLNDQKNYRIISIKKSNQNWKR